MRRDPEKDGMWWARERGERQGRVRAGREREKLEGERKAREKEKHMWNLTRREILQ